MIWDQTEGGRSALAYFACYPSQENTAFEDGAAAIAGAQLLQKLPKDVPVLFVGHSFGGLVTKYYFLTHPEELDPDRIAAVTINSPHQGTPVYLLGYVTGESLLLDFKPTRSADPFGLGGNPLLERLLLRRLRLQLSRPARALHGRAADGRGHGDGRAVALRLHHRRRRTLSPGCASGSPRSPY